MKIILITILLNFFSLTNNYILHPIHISVTNIYYNKTENIFDVSIKLFTDDFEKIVNTNYSTNLNLGKKNELKQANVLIDKYIQSNLNVEVNNKNFFKNAKLHEKRLVYGNVIWLYYKIKPPSSIKKVKVTNNLMNDMFNDQTNLFIFTYKNTEEAYKFEKNNTKFEFLIK